MISYFQPMRMIYPILPGWPFPGNIKGSENTRSFSPHTFFEQDRPILTSLHIFQAWQTDPLFLTSAADHHSTQGEHTQFMDCCFLGNHSFIICSSLLDQRILKASNWMFNSHFWHQQLNSCSDISKSFLLLFIQLIAQVILSQKLKFWNSINILVDSFVFFLLFI